MLTSRKVDQVLEKLRNEVKGPPNLDTLILNLRRVTSRVHAGFLFEAEGKLALQKLCLLLSSTAPGKMYRGWQDFASQIGLTTEQIRCIEFSFHGLEDPTNYVLKTYVQLDDATLDKIVHTLQKIERLDIILQIKDYIHDLVNGIPYTIPQNEILRPKSLPRVPLVLTPIIEINEKPAALLDAKKRIFSQEAFQRASARSQKTKRKYNSTVMLTFADDGSKIAPEIAKIFRAREEKIGVLILEEQKQYVYSRAEEFIDDCFNQVNYIIPILTQGYVEKLYGQNTAYTDNELKLDEKYLRYVYSLLRYEYARNNCWNNRVRCIVPDEEVKNITSSFLHPTLQAWFKMSNIDDFIENIILRKF